MSSTYAVIEASGGQLKVTQDLEILIDLVESGAVEQGKSITFDKVLLVGGNGATKIGAPYVAGATVTAQVLEPEFKGEKIYIHKHRPKKTYKRKTGHRQRYTRVKITGING
ncbi:MAG: 50S ribosomal protein L21 [Phycisphaeraceae bacterium]|nr:50S ribosomal protein L21 [Phycisphaeraceae bacterium]